jgi:regulator of sirC expression with transglutaminase-like and TPR domain
VIPASSRAILVRMLVNLKGIYFSRGDYSRAHLALDRIVSLTPDSVAALKGRALLAAKLGSIAAARADLTRVLELDPDADDAAATRATLARLQRKPVALN